MRLAVLCTLACAACSSGDALVVVTVTTLQPLTDVAKLHANATAAGHTQAFDVAFTGGTTFTIPPKRTFAVQIPQAFAGAFSITLDAISTGAVTLLSGTNSTTTSAGQRVDLPLVLGGGNPMDMGEDANFDAGGDGACVQLSCAQANYGCGMLTSCGMTVDCGACMVTSVHPAIANTGDTIVLEGAFNPTAIVVFPGGINATPTLLGPNRATVVVPATATTGLLAINVGGGVVLLKQPFRRANFKMAIHDFQQNYEQTDAARPMPAVSADRSSGAAVQVGQVVAVFGGESHSGPTPSPLPSIEEADINADGTVGLMGLQTQPNRRLVNARVGFVTYNSPSGPWVIGGSDDATQTYTSVEHASTNGDGSGIDTFSLVSGVNLNVGRFYPASAVIGSYFYVFGGSSAASIQTAVPVTSIERAPISATDGSLGAFQMVTTTLNHARIGAGAYVARDRVYLIGGFDSSAFLTSVEEAPINPDGSLGAFTQSVTTGLQVDRALPGVVELGGVVYVLGGASTLIGTTSPTPVTSIEKAPLGADGTLGAFQSAGVSLATSRVGTPLLIGNYLYYFQDGGGPTGSTAERSSIFDMSASISNFTDSGRMLPRFGMASAVVGKYVYMFGGNAGPGGGNGPQRSINKALINEDGTLAAFNSMNVSQLSVARVSPAVVVLNRDVFVCGGLTGAGIEATCDQFRANYDGSLMIQPSSGINMSKGRSSFHMVALNGFLYAVGGEAGVSFTYERLPLDPQGRPLGTVMAQPSPAPAFADISHNKMGVLFGGRDYLIGGDGPTDTAESSDDTLPPNYTLAGAKLLQGVSDATLFSNGFKVLLVGGVIAAPATVDMSLGPVGVVTNQVAGALLINNGPGNMIMSNFVAAAQTLLIARRGAAGFATNSFFYLVGGTDQPTAGIPIGPVEQAVFQ